MFSRKKLVSEERKPVVLHSQREDRKICKRINGNSVMMFDQYCYCLEEILRFPEFSKNDN